MWTAKLNDTFGGFLGTLIAFLSIKNLFKFVVPLTLFVEELSLFNYHRQAEYPPFMRRCIEEVDMVVFLKSKPLMNVVHFNNSIGTSSSKSLAYTRMGTMSVGPKSGLEDTSFYFLYSAKDILTYSFIFNVFVFSFSWLLKKLVGCIVQRNPLYLKLK